MPDLMKGRKDCGQWRDGVCDIPSSLVKRMGDGYATGYSDG